MGLCSRHGFMDKIICKGQEQRMESKKNKNYTSIILIIGIAHIFVLFYLLLEIRSLKRNIVSLELSSSSIVDVNDESRFDDQLAGWQITDLQTTDSQTIDSQAIDSQTINSPQNISRIIQADNTRLIQKIIREELAVFFKDLKENPMLSIEEKKRIEEIDREKYEVLVSKIEQFEANGNVSASEQEDLLFEASDLNKNDRTTILRRFSRAITSGRLKAQELQ